MTRLFLIIFLISGGLLQTVSAQQARFDEATDLLEMQEYREAIDLYRSIADDGYSSGALWLNMGIAYSRLDSLGVSKYFLLKASDYRETHELAEEALTYVNERFSRRSAVLPPLPWDLFFESLARSPGKQNLFIFGFLLLYGGVGFMIAGWFTVNRQQLWKWSAIALIALSALVFASALYINYLDTRFGTGVLTDRQSVVHQQPDPDSGAVSTAYEGYTMRIDHRRSEGENGWYFVRLENGMTGWIDRDVLMTF